MRETKFKMTEVGLVPEDWEVKIIGHICSISTGSKNTQDKIDCGKYPFFVRSQDVERIDTYSYDCEAVLTAGDGVGTGKVFHYINGKFEVHQRVYIMNNFASNVSGKYFFRFFALNFSNRINQMTAKSSVDSVRKDMIYQMNIPLPPLPEQQKIAKALSDVDRLISSLDALIAKKRDIKKGTMQQLLTGKKRLPGFTEPWVEYFLGNIYKFAREGGTPSTGEAKYYYPGQVPFAKIDDLKSKYLYKTDNNISYEGLEHSSAWLVPKDSLLLSNGATLGEVSINKIPLATKQGILGIVLKDEFCCEFIYYLFQEESFKKQMSKVTTLGTMECAYLKDLNTIFLNIPSLPEQTAIASILSSMDDEISALEAKRDKYISIKQGMMQELLTGKTRLV